jgi:hypothetical protein
MTNQRNKTFCNIVSNFGKKKKGLNCIGPSFCFFAHSSCCSDSLERAETTRSAPSSSVLLLWKFLVISHFPKFSVLWCSDCSTPILLCISGERPVICIHSLTGTRLCATDHTNSRFPNLLPFPIACVHILPPPPKLRREVGLAPF